MHLHVAVFCITCYDSAATSAWSAASTPVQRLDNCVDAACHHTSCNRLTCLTFSLRLLLQAAVTATSGPTRTLAGTSLR